MASEERADPNAPPAQHGQHTAIRAFQLDGAGLRRLLGSLEADLLEAVWRLTPGDATTGDGWVTIGDVCAALRSPLHYKTAQTVMNRLVEKRLLVRRERQRAYEYRAALTRDELIMQVTRSVVGGLIHDFGDVAVAQLAQTLYETRPELLAQLERLAGTVQPPPSPVSGSTSNRADVESSAPLGPRVGADIPPTPDASLHQQGKRAPRKRKE